MIHLGQQLRDQFPCLACGEGNGRLSYLDSAASALKPQVVADAVRRCYLDTPANVHRGIHTLSEQATAAYEGARDRVARFIHAGRREEIIFTSGATDAINLVAYGFGGAALQAGDEILITGMEHHANIVPWQMLRDRQGVVLKVAPMTASGELDVDAFKDTLSSHTKLVAFTAVSNAIGTVLPVEELTALAHQAGAAVLVDAAQAVSCQPVDVQAWDCDFLAFSGHKLFGPTGIGVLYARESMWEQMQPFKGGGEMILSVTFEKTVYNEPPYKFEAGTPPIASAIGLGTALDWVESLELEAVHTHVQGLAESAVEALSKLPGVTLIGTPRHRHAIVSFVLDGIHAHDAGTLLDEAGIAVRAGHHCAQPVMAHFGVPATVRASFSVYNDEDDIAQLVSGIAHVRKVFA